MSIKAWDWDKTWKIIQSKCTHGYESVPNKFYEQTYKGHTRYIMNLDFKSKYADTILSACFDSTINMWTLGPSNFSMQEHEKGVELPQATPRVNGKSLSFIPIYPSESSSVAVKMEQPRCEITAFISSKTRSAIR